MTIALIVEDGSKVANANSYVTLEEAQAYHTLLNNEEWTEETNDELKKIALIQATQSIDLNYSARFLSWLVPGTLQPLQFPRLWFFDLDGREVKDTTIPTCLKNAVIELALMQLNGEDIFPLPSDADNIAVDEITVGGISIRKQSFGRQEAETFAGFRKIDTILRPILKAKNARDWRLLA